MISVIIPTLNEEKCLEKTILSAKKGDVEIIVADGGSNDGTVALASKMADKVVSAGQGRGPQMNVGASTAKGDILLFLHADTVLPEIWDRSVIETLHEPLVAGGAFRFSVAEKNLPFRFIAFLVNLRSKYLSLPYGDQAIFVKKDIFEKIGGFREIPIMEDVELVRSIRKYGKIRIAEAPVEISPRRWSMEGWIKTTIRNQILLFFFFLGVPPEKLYRFYKAVR